MLKFESQFAEKEALNGTAKQEYVPVRNGKLDRQNFGKMLMRAPILSEEVFVIDYYGLFKKTEGFLKMLVEMREANPYKQVKSILVPVVHFASVRPDRVAALAPDLVAGFPTFKKTILDARGFKHRYGR